MPERLARRLAQAAAAAWHRPAGIAHELTGGLRKTGDAKSRLRFVSDIVLFRALRYWPALGTGANTREILLDGARLSYRLNRGDIQGIREVWLDGIYTMPTPCSFRIVVDLGTNIGLTAVWLQRKYAPDFVLGVEADGSNVHLARQNLRENGVKGRVIHAAVGPADGHARFSAPAGVSNLGRVGATGKTVRQISMESVLAEIPAGRHVDLLKLDIEGGEQDLLLAEDVDWLQRVDAIIAEFHPAVVDVSRLVAVLERHGFAYMPAGTLWPGSMDIFRRPGPE